MTTNTTIFKETEVDDVIQMMEYLTNEVGIDGMLVAPGYQYSQIDLNLTMTRDEHEAKFRLIRDEVRQHGYKWLASPVYQDFLTGDRKPPARRGARSRGTPTAGRALLPAHRRHLPDVRGAGQRDRVGALRPGNDHRCEHCGIHSGFEPAATIATTSSVKETVRSLAGRSLAAERARKLDRARRSPMLACALAVEEKAARDGGARAARIGLALACRSRRGASLPSD